MQSLRSPREGPIGSLRFTAEEHGWAREIVPTAKSKKKPKDKLGLPKLTSLSEPPPQQAELIRKPRKPKPVEEETDEG